MNKRDENIPPHGELTFLETFLEEVGLELDSELDSAGKGALIGREQTTSERGIASMKLRHRKCLQWEITGGDLGSG